MDTANFGVLIVAFVVLACMMHDTEAAVGEVCSADNCTGDGEECDGTACACSQDYYQNGNNCFLKVGYNGPCTVSPPACQAAFVCTDNGNGAQKCLCESGKYYDGSICPTINQLMPVLILSNPTTNSISTSWFGQATLHYTTLYFLTWKTNSSDVPTGSYNSTNEMNYIIPSLTPGTEYTVSIIRQITERVANRVQTIQGQDQSETTRIGYNQSCSSNLCFDQHTTCYHQRCRCGAGYYWSNMCKSIEDFKPQAVVTYVTSTTTVYANWTSTNNPVVTGYNVMISPWKTGIVTVITGKTVTISGLTPGELYNVTVKSEIIYVEGRNEETSPTSATPKRTTPAKTTGIDGSGKTTLNEPTIQIWFHKAVGLADSYIVRLHRMEPDPYDHTEYPGNTGNVISADFSNVTAGRIYTLTIITSKDGFRSEPFTTMIRVKAKQAGTVRNLRVGFITSRSIFVTWMRPEKPNGEIYQYIMNTLTNSHCVQGVVFNCTECSRDLTNEASSVPCDKTQIKLISKSDIDNDDFQVSHNVTDLLPDSNYLIRAAAYNHEGEGVAMILTRQTNQEAAGPPTYFSGQSESAGSILLTWKPPIPRPGVTGYNVVVNERSEDDDSYIKIREFNVTEGYEVDYYNVTGLSSYWDYTFTIMAFTWVGRSQFIPLPPVKTKESKPTQVVDLHYKRLDNVYDQVQISWKCPKQKDGRNGEIQSGTVRFTTDTTSAELTPKEGAVTFPVRNCNWKVTVNVTAEFNYTFVVYVSNNEFSGEEGFFQIDMPAGPPPTLDTPAIGRLMETSVQLEVCLVCLYNNKNGRIVKAGLLVCQLGFCPTRHSDKIYRESYYDSLPNWDTARGNGFTSWYRATANNWLDRKADKETFVLGGESCSLEDQNNYCNGPLPANHIYRIWFFACTSAACTESDHLEISLTQADAPLPASTIAAIVSVIVVIIVICIIITVVYIKVIKPRVRSSSNNRYRTDTTQDTNEDTYEDIVDSHRLSAIQDGSREPDYYNTTFKHSNNTYDELTPYINGDQHDYGRISDTPT